MSFDIELNYAPVITGLTNRMSILHQQCEQNTIIITQIQSTQYSTLLHDETTRMLSIIDRDTIVINHYQAILAEIARIQSLPYEAKQLLYYFYKVLGVDKVSYMIKMLFNTSALSDQNVLAVYSDVITIPQTKLIVAKMLYNRFTVSSLYDEIKEVGYYL